VTRCFNPRFFLSSCDDSSSRIWELETGEYVSVLAGHTAAVYISVAAADQNLVLTASKDLTVRAWSITAALQSTVRCLPSLSAIVCETAHIASDSFRA
jgi:WD40 repeat protein